MAITPDTQAAVSFLLQWAPTGPWVLTGITTDKQSIETKAFDEEHVEDMTAWLTTHNGKRNIYFLVNPPIRLEDKKAARSNIASLSWLHVDIDPRAGEDFEDERSRILTMLQNPPCNVPAPTVLINSGGGYQAFWALEEAFPINGDKAAYEEAKRWNLQIEMIFGADSCHNVDRIMRVPGTINLPDKNKAAKGRKAALAELVYFNEEAVFSLSQFNQAAPTAQSPGGQQTGAFALGSREAVAIEHTVTRLNDVHDLDQWNVPDRIKVIVVQGRHPIEGPKQKDDSRSAWLFDCLCGLCRAGVPDEVIYSVVTDPDFGISESVLDKGTESENYATRQIFRAREHSINPLLTEMNDRHAVIESFGGKCLVIEEVDIQIGTTHRSILTPQSFADIRNRYMNRSVEVGKNKKGEAQLEPLGNWWLKHENRRQYRGIVFSPDREVPGYYNLWRGFTCSARQGNCELFLTHLLKNLCRGHQDYFDYLIGWMANCVQHPAMPGHTAIVLRGSQGVGKSFFAKTFGSLFGRHFIQVSSSKHLVGNFNAHLRDCVVLFGDEAFFAGDKEHESSLKTLITEETMQIESKGVNVETCHNFLHIILASNNDWVIPAGANERRYFVLDVSDDVRQNSKYFGGIQAQLDAGGREALLHYLMHYDLSEFNVRNVPKTLALRDQQQRSLAPEYEWWLHLLRNGHIDESSEDWPEQYPIEKLRQNFVEYTKSYSKRHLLSDTALGQFLFRICPGMQAKQRRIPVSVRQPDGSWVDSTQRRRCYLLPPLATCRKMWEEKQGETDWPDVTDLDMGENNAQHTTAF